MPAVALTDHGSLAGAVELYREARKAGVKPIIGCEVYVADDRRAQTKGYAHLTLLAESNEGYANLIKLSSLGYLEGYYYKPRVDWELLERHAKGLVALSGLPLGPRLQGARGEPAEGRAPPTSTASPRSSAATRPTSRSRTPGSTCSSGSTRSSRSSRTRPGCRSSRPATSTTSDARGRARARGAALHPVGRLAEEPEPLEVRHRPVLLQDAGRDGAATSPAYEEALRAHARDRRALQRRRSSSGGSCCRSSRCPTAATRSTTSSSSARRASQKRYGTATPELTERLQFELKTIREMGFADYFLIVWDFIHFAKQNGISVGPGPRLGRRLARRLLPRDHRRRPDPLRPPLRALPQPGPQVHAGHGHRLLGRRPRPGHQLRRREVRARPRRADHHLRDDDGPRRGARRRPRARDPVRHRRPDREADPGRARRSTSTSA